jgi:Zn-dependent M28 family amino/carboxypeptidase
MFSICPTVHKSHRFKVVSSRVMARSVLVAGLLAIASCGQRSETEVAEPKLDPAPPATPAHAFSPAIRAEDFAAHVARLASDEFEGRAPGSRGERLTVEYLTEHYRRIGLEPALNGSYLQPVPMVEITRTDERPLKLVGEGVEMTLVHMADVVLGTARAEEKVALADAPLVFLGYGVDAPEYGWNDYADVDVNGKTVVVLVNDPGFATGDPALFRGRTMTYYGRWTYKFEEAARKGAAAALIVHETEAASYPWEVVQNSWSGPQFELPDGPDSPRRLLVQGWIHLDAARKLFAAAGKDFDALAKAAAGRGFQPVELPFRASIEIDQRIRRAESPNVIGLLRGSEAPDEYVLYMAHWDHLGRIFGRPGSEGIFNGAIDNATGVSGLLEIAEALAAGPRPRRSIVFAAVTLEESGLLGSRWYAEHPPFPLEKTAAVINMDALTVLGPSRDVVVIGFGNSELEDYLKEAAATQNRIVVPEEFPERGYYYRSDHFNFAKKGVPALYAKGGSDHREHGQAWGKAQLDDYNANRYHKPGDVFDPNWDLRGVVEDLTLLYDVGRRVASEARWPEWYPGTEFRAVRETSRAQRETMKP